MKYFSSGIAKVTSGEKAQIRVKQELFAARRKSPNHFINPRTTPNIHNKENIGTIGGIPQEHGIRQALGMLAETTAKSAVLFSKALNRPQDIDEIIK